MKKTKFYISEYNEIWILTHEGKWPNGEIYYNFDIEGTDNKIENFSRDEFDQLFKEDIILTTKS